MKIDPRILEHLSEALDSGRKDVEEVVYSFFRARGYMPSVYSLHDGHLVLEAAPAERALMRYDLPLFRTHLLKSSVASRVKSVSVRAA